MATIRKAGIKWEAQIRRDGFPNRSKRFVNRKDAEQWARDLEREIDRGIYLPKTASEKTTIGMLCDAWEETVLPGKRSTKTHFNGLLKTIKAAFGSRAVATLTSSDIAEWRDKRLKTVSRRNTPLSESTVRKEIIFLSTLIDFGISDRGLILAANPARQVGRPPEPRHRDRRFVGDEEERILTAARGSAAKAQLVPLIVVGIETGARLGELLALQWHEVDFKHGIARLHGKEIDGKRQLKNRELYRDIPLSPRAIQALQGMTRPITGGQIFSNWKRSDSFTKTFARTCETAEIEGFHFHDLRHEFASRIAPRVQMHVLMKLLGHKSPAMVARYYQQTRADVAKLGVELYGPVPQSSENQDQATP